MEDKMKKASDNLQYEKAITIRDRIRMIKEVIYRRQFQVNAVDNNNLVAIYSSKDAGSAELFFIRKAGLQVSEQYLSRTTRKMNYWK